MMGTKVRGFAPLPKDVSLEDLVSEDHFYRRLEARLEEHLAGAFPEDIPFAQEEDLPGAVVAGFVGPEVDERRELTRQNAPRHCWNENNGRQERESLRWGYRRMANLRVSTTDPDASPMHQKKKGASKLGYLTHYLVDGVRRA